NANCSCTAGFGLSINKSGCFNASDIRRHAMSKYFGSISMPMNLRPKFTAATPVVPEPMNGSMTVSALGKNPRHHSINGTGFCVGCSLTYESTDCRHTLAGIERLVQAISHMAREKS